MNEVLHALARHLPARLRVETQGSSVVYSAFTAGHWIPVYQAGTTSGFWTHGERHLEYALREEAESRGWNWQLEAGPDTSHARVSGAQRMCSEQGHGPAFSLVCAVLSMLEQTA